MVHLNQQAIMLQEFLEYLSDHLITDQKKEIIISISRKHLDQKYLKRVLR